MMHVRLPFRVQSRLSVSGSRLAVLCALAALGQSLTACNQKDPDATVDDAPTDTTSDDGTEPVTTTDDSTESDPETDPTTSDPTTSEPTDSDDTSGDDTGGTGGTDTGGSDTSDPTTDPGSDSDAGPTEPPPDTSGTTEPPDGMEIPQDEMLEYFPMVDGATWTYRHSKTAEAAWSEITTMVAGTGADEGSFVLSDSPDRQDDITTQWWKQVGTAIVRVKREETRNGSVRTRTTYDPGFTRFDTLWSKEGFEQEISYTHVETDVDGTVTSERVQHFIVLDIDASVTIDSNTYDHCIQIARTRPDTMDVGHYWFAKGIGKIKEVDPESLTTEELIAFDIP